MSNILKKQNFLPLLFLLLLFLFSLLSPTAIAGVPNRQFVSEQEEEAKQIGKLWNGEEIRRSISLYLEASNNWLKLNENKRASMCLREIAKLSLQIHDYEKASTVLKKSLKIDRKINNIEGQVLSLSLLSQLEEHKNNFSKSILLFKQALLLSKNSTDYSKAYANFVAGEFFIRNANLKSSENYVAKAEMYSKKIEDIDLKAKILLNCGISHSIQSHYKKALFKIKEAQKLWEKTESKRGRAISFSTLGFVYVISNEKHKAFENFKLAESMFPDGVDIIEKAKIYSGFAKINSDYGQDELTEIHLRKAIELYELIKYDIGEVFLLPNFAKVLMTNGKNEEGLKFFNRSIKLAEKLNNDFVLAISNELHGLENLENGQNDEAISKFLKAEQMFLKTGLRLPRLKNHLGNAYLNKGDYKIARKYFNEALNQNRKYKDVIEIGKDLYHLARLSKLEGKFEQGLEEIEEAISITESVYADVGNNNLRQSFLSDVFDRYELFINLLMKMHRQFPEKGFEIRALQASERSRSRLMLELIKLSEAEFIRDADPNLILDEKTALERLNEKSNELTEVQRNNGSDREISKLRDELNQIENELETIKDELRRKSPIYSAIKNPTNFDIKHFQQKILDNQTVLLEFSFGKEESYLWAISKNKLDVFVLPGSLELDNDLDELRHLLISNEIEPSEEIIQYQQRIFEAEFKYQRKAKKLSYKLFGQVVNEISDKRLLIVPDGKLKYFPVSALPFPVTDAQKDANKPFLMTNEILYEPSATTLELLLKLPQDHQASKKNLLIFSDPVVSRNDKRISNAKIVETKSTKPFQRSVSENLPKPTTTIDSLQRLYASGNEAESLLATFGFNSTTIISGFDANRQNLMNFDLENYKIIHFATHGSLDENRPELSGIVLSRFDEKGDQMEGLVRLQDIYSLNLSANLVVLSACDTGIGKDIKGEGLMSLTNAFLQNGAKSVVSSRWKVDDFAALELMEDFYQILSNEQITPSQALRKAQINMLKDSRFNSPYYWAAFTIQGDFRQIPEVSRKFDYSQYLYFISLIFGLFVIFSVYKAIQQKMNK